jgi:hypothetical protein
MDVVRLFWEIFENIVDEVRKLKYWILLLVEGYTTNKSILYFCEGKGLGRIYTRWFNYIRKRKNFNCA